ncbi:MAG: PrsW family intramembrane metalloprotease [Ruminococcaceae bacterium]|nr:PrsW family intramembrane metalloprotease [Oscillospiraceae bacterium]
MRTVFLVIAALLPAVILCLYIYKKDRVEKEPARLLFTLLIGGVACCYPAAVIEGVFLDIIEKGVMGFYLSNGADINPKIIYTAHKLLENFIGIALVEEGLKLLVLLWFTKNNSEFNSVFDGIVYAVFVSLGFAAFENILYVLQYGFSNAMMRAVTSVPGHMFFAVMMGYYYSFAHIAGKVSNIELELKINGVIPKTVRSYLQSTFIGLALFAPVFAHGMYDYCCTYETRLAVLVFYAFLIGMYVYCFGKIKKMSAGDAPVRNYVYMQLLRKYPELSEHLQSEEFNL